MICYDHVVSFAIRSSGSKSGSGRGQCSLHATFIVCVRMQETASFVIHRVVCGAQFASRIECGSNDVMRHWRLYSLTNEGRAKGRVEDRFSFECIVLDSTSCNCLNYSSLLSVTIMARHQYGECTLSCNPERSVRLIECSEAKP